MRLSFSLLLFLICSTAFSADDPGKLKPVGYIRADFWSNHPLCLNRDTEVTSHLRNISDAPLKLKIHQLHYQPAFISVSLPAKGIDVNGEFGVWGPTSIKDLTVKQDFLTYSGFLDSATPTKTWPKRAGIILFRGEGYARKILFKTKWLETKELSYNAKSLILNDSPSLMVSKPLIEAESVQPGKAILFDTAEKVYAPGGRLIPFLRSANNQTYIQKEHSIDATSGLCLDLEFKAGAADQDLELTYLIGNCGAKTIWIEQDSLLPAHIKFELLQRGKSLAKIDGSDFKALLDLYPLRKAIPLNPGEFLSFRRVLRNSSLTLSKRQKYILQAELQALWFSSVSMKKDEQKSTLLKCHATFYTK